jgi:hypothetical protein
MLSAAAAASLSAAAMRRAACLLHVRLPLRRGRIKKFQQDNALDVNSELHAALSLSEQVINALGRQSPVSTAVNELHLFVYIRTLARSPNKNRPLEIFLESRMCLGCERPREGLKYERCEISAIAHHSQIARRVAAFKGH